MTDGSKSPRDAMATTQSKRRAACESCAAIHELRAEFHEYRDRTDSRLADGSDEMSTLAAENRELRRTTADGFSQSNGLIREVLASVNTLSVSVNTLSARVATGNTIAGAIRSGRDIETKTPSGKPMPEISIGSVKARAPAWLYGALVTLALVLVAAVATVGVVLYFGGSR